MAVFLWLENIALMKIYPTVESFQNQRLFAVDDMVWEYIHNQTGFTIMIEDGTPVWN